MAEEVSRLVGVEEDEAAVDEEALLTVVEIRVDLLRPQREREAELLRVKAALRLVNENVVRLEVAKNVKPILSQILK